MRESGCAVVRQGRLMALVGTFLIGCAFLLIVIGCSGTRSEAPQEEEGQGRTEATKKEQTRQPEATASEQARCEGTRTFQKVGTFTTNDLPGCPKGGPLLGTNKADKLGGKEGKEEIRGLGAADFIFGGVGDDVIYAGPGDDMSLYGDEGDDVIYGGDGDDGFEEGKGADVIYGGDGNDEIFAFVDDQRDQLYCGKGKDVYHAPEMIDYVSSSCETKAKIRSVP